MTRLPREYGPSGPLWATNTWTGGFVIMQGDGNFVGYDMWDTPKWSTGTGGDGSNCDMVLQNDSNLVLYCGGVPKWDRYHGRLTAGDAPGQVRADCKGASPVFAARGY